MKKGLNSIWVKEMGGPAEGVAKFPTVSSGRLPAKKDGR